MSLRRLTYQLFWHYLFRFATWKHQTIKKALIPTFWILRSTACIFVCIYMFAFYRLQKCSFVCVCVCMYMWWLMGKLCSASDPNAWEMFLSLIPKQQPAFFSLHVNVVDLLEKRFLTACSTRIIAVWCLKVEATSLCAHKTSFPPSGSKLLPVLPPSLFLGQLSDISWGHGTYISIVITSNLWRSICLTIKRREEAERILLLIQCFNEPGN